MTLRRLASFALAAMTASALVRCSSFGEEAAPSPDGGDGALPSEGGGPGEGGAGDAALEASEASARCASGCPGTAGPCGVKIGGLCIDATEVTVADYDAFVAAKRGQTIDAGAPCPPVVIGPVASRQQPDLPVTGVSFCEARAYCSWSGKHLCGNIRGGPLSRADEGTVDNAWLYACTAGTSSTVILDGSCQLAEAGPRPAGSTCEGAVPGLYDMVGNVVEWIDSTDDAAIPGAYFVGGSYGHAPETNCNYLSGALITFRGPDLGFRCCSP